MAQGVLRRKRKCAKYERPGCPFTTNFDEKIFKVEDSCEGRSRLDIRMTADEFNIDKGTVIKLVTTNMNQWRIQIR
jgi:hypothetical protein